MSNGFQRLDLPNGVRYVLPRRPGQGGLQFIPLFIGVTFTITFGAAALLTRTAALEPHPLLFRLVLALVGLFGTPVMIIGIFHAFGHVEIEHAGGLLKVTSSAGPLTWTRRRSSQGLRLVEAIHTPGVVNGKTATSGPIADNSMLRGTWEGGSTMTLAAAFPISLTRSLAQDLTLRLGASPSTRPANSNALLRTHPGGLTLILPPLGARKGSMGFLWFAIGWCLWIPTCGALVYWIKGPNLGLLWAGGVLLGSLELIGVAILVIAINMGRQKATLEIASGRLRVAIASPFLKRTYDWALSEIGAIERAPSGHTTNGIPHMGLRITPAIGEPVGLLAGRDTVELLWIAEVLSHELRQQNPPSAEPR